MTEEVKDPVNGAQVEQQGAKEPSALELKAIEMGWRPREEFEGSDDDFIDAKEFVRRAPLFEKIEHTTKEVKELRKAFNALKTHYSKVQETEFNRALKALQGKRREAISNSDGDAAVEIEEEIKRVEAAKEVLAEQQQEPPQQQEEHPDFVAWKNRNRWYTTDEAMQAFADKRGNKYASQGMEPNDVLRQVEKDVRKEFAHKLRNPNKEDAPLVEGKSGGKLPSKEDPFESTLNDTERRIMNTLVREGVMTKAEYLADLKKVRN